MSRRRAILGASVAATLAASLLLGAWWLAREPAEAGSARAAVAARRWDEARGLLDRWAALAPRGGEPDYQRALMEVQAGRPAEALDAMRRAVAKGHPEPPVLILRAVLLARAGRFAEAEPVLARAFEESTGPRVEVAEGLSRVYLKTFRLVESLKVLDAWSKAAPEDARPYVLRNEALERLDAEPALVLRTYREALRRDPGLLDARLGLADKLRGGGKYDEAGVEYDELLRRDPANIRALAGAGRIALVQGDLATATRLFERVLALDPDDKFALRELGLIDLNAGRYAEARARLGRAVAASPHDPEVRYSYSRALKLTGDEPRAAEEAAATERLKKEQQTINELRQSLVQRHDDVDLRCTAARWLIEHGHEKEGLEWTGLILRQQPGHPATCQLLADYHAKRGEAGLANFYRLGASPAAPPR